MSSKAIAILIIVIILVALLVFIAFKVGLFKDKEKQTNIQIFYTDIFLTTLGENGSIDTDYSIYDENLQLIKWGETRKESVAEIELEQKKDYTFLIKADGYYTKLGKLFATDLYKSQKEVQTTLAKIGNLTVTQSEPLKEGANKLTLNLSADGKLKKLGFCFSWSPNLIYVNFNVPNQTCSQGNWLNYTKYNETSKEYTYLPEGIKRCGEELEECSRYLNFTCEPKQMDIPSRLDEIDRCYYYGETLDDNNVLIDIEYKALPLNERDKIDMYIIDKDLVYFNNLIVYRDSVDGLDIAKEDILVEIK